MFRWLRFYIDICLLRAAPQDAPSSKTVQYLTIVLYWAAGAALTSLNQSIWAAMFIAFIQTILVLFFINLALWIRKYPDRIIQTVTAFTGSGLIITAAAFPIIGWLSQPELASNLLFTLFWVALVIWETTIVAHIFKHALEIPLYYII
jgi:hypothetical protein